MNAIKVFFIASMCIAIGHRCFTAKLNIRKCKLTHSGIEYRGNVFITKFKSLCRPWNSIGVEPDSNFADGSRVSAKNFCRNPNGTRDDLWCYTYNVDNSVELCAVPLCYAKSKTRCRDECRLTGPGVEYGGYANVTKSGYACSKWSDVEDSSAADSKFPDGGRSAAGNRCRNPTGDPGGPWCYTFVDRVTVSDYCDTPSCDDGVCHWTFINGGWSSGHGHYTTMPISIKDDDGGGGGLVSFELKTWHPAIIRTDQPLFRVSLTAYPTVSSGDGFEVPVPIDVFARSGTAEIARVDVSWRNGFVVLSAGNPSASREVSSLELNATLSPMVYLSFTGDYSTAAPVAVRFVHCDLRTAGQEEHVTNSQDAYRIFPLKKSIVSTSELSFSVRAVISASVTYYTTPTKQTPRLIMEFAAWPVQKIKIIFIEKSNSEEQMIFNQTYEMDVISYWKWHQYEITIADKILQIQATDERDKNPTIMLKITDSKLRFFHWFTIGSKTVAHWTLYCNGPEFYPLPEATLPECVISKTSENYRGTQWITENGIPCVPWNVSSVRKLVKERTLIDRSYVKAKNYCRNPTKDPDGPYCYVVVGGRENAAVEKRSCRVRKCRNTRCSVTGIATDYVGKLNKTVSNRTCLKWSSHTGAGYAFPDGSALAASNYCRNPTRAPTGAWCRVGGAAETDSCDVPACSEDGGGGGGDSDTLLIGGDGVHWMHVLPDWRGQSGLRMRLKRWAPGVYEGASLRFRRPGHPSTYDLVQVGADGDEKIKLYRLMSRNEERRLATTAADDEIVYPHLLMASRWTELVFRLGDDDRGEDGQSITTVTMSSAAGGEIFSWTLSSNSTDGGGGRIAFVGLSAITSRGYVATRFPAEEDCLIHSSESQNFSVFLPINVRSNRSLTSAKPEIVFRIKHTGVTCIALMSRKFSERHVLEINGGRAVLWNEGKRSKKSLGEYESKTGEIFTAGNWTRILLSWNESVLRMDCGGVHGWHWNVGRERPLLVRYFSVANRGGGRTKWTVNCDESWRRLPDVDGPPRDGGWGEWGQWERCTKSCGGGTGVRSRRCDSPRPNVSGRPCPGPAMAAGACNQHECGQVSVKTAAAVRRLLAGRAHNAAATVGDRLTILCDPATVDAIRADSPRARFRWLRNGKTATSTIADDKTDRCALVIGSCTIHDSGVYAFVAEPPKSERIVLKLFAVAINDKPISVYIGDVVRVQCNAATLSYFFNRLSQEWLVNDSYVIKNYGINSLASIDVDTITIENKHFQGIWKCVVRSTEINSTWVTNAMEIKVIGLSTRWTQIMQDPIIKILFRNRSPTTIILICTILISTLCVGTWCCAYIFNRWRKQITNKSSKGIQIKDYGIHKKVPYQHL